MLKPKNDYKWNEIWESSSPFYSDARRRLFAKPKEVFKEYGIEFSSDIEIVILESDFGSGSWWDYIFVLPMFDDVDVVEPIDTWTKIAIKARSSSTSKLDLITHSNEILGPVELGSDADEIAIMKAKQTLAQRIQSFLGEAENLDVIIDDLIAFPHDAADMFSVSLVEDTIDRKHFVGPTIHETNFHEFPDFITHIFLGGCSQYWP
jgi:hypothetical protein